MGEEHRSVGITANNLAVVSYNQGNLDSAVHYGEQAVRSLRLALGDDHQRSVIAQMNLAAFKSRAGDYAAAEVEYRDLLERQRRLQGPDHPVVGIIMDNLGRALWRQGKHVEAEEVFRKTLTLREARLGPNHTDVASTLAGLADAVAGQERVKEAVEHQARAVEIRRQGYGDRDARVGRALVELAEFQELIGDTVSAEASYREAASIFDERLTRTHARTIGAYQSLGQALLRNGNVSEALEVYTTAHARALERTNQSLARQTRLGLAEAYLAVDDYAKADSLLAVSEEDGDLSETAARRLAELKERLNPTRHPAQ